MFRRKKFIILFLVIFLFLIGLFTRNVLMQDKIAENALQNLNPHHQATNDLIKLYGDKLKEDPNNEKLQNSYENVVQMEYDISDIENAVKNHDWISIPKTEADFLKRVTTHLELGGDYHLFQDNELEQKIKKNAILLTRHLPYENESYSLTMPIFVKYASSLFISILGVLILVFIMADQLSEEYDHQTIRTLYTQPIRKWRILLSKYANMMTSAFFMLFVFLLISSALPLLFGGETGNFSYPQLVQYSDGFTYISTWTYLIKLAVLFLGAASFSFSLVLLVSLLLKTRFVTILVSVLILFFGVMVTNQIEAWQTVQNPFFFFQFTELIEQPEYPSPFGNIWIPFAYSFIVLFICFFIQGKGTLFRTTSPTKRPFNKGQTPPSSNSILPVVLFEWRKTWRQTSTKQTIFVLLLLFLFGYVFLTYQTVDKKHSYMETMDSLLEDQKDEVERFKQYL